MTSDVERDLVRLRAGFGAWTSDDRGEDAGDPAPADDAAPETGARYVERLRCGARPGGS